MCVFCEIGQHQTDAHIVYEDEKTVAFLDIDPINEGHVLIVPKEHLLDIDEIEDELLQHMLFLSKRIAKAIKKLYSPDGYTIMQNGGIFNDLGHYHLHVFPRYEGDGFGWTDSGKTFEYSERVAQKIREVL